MEDILQFGTRVGAFMPDNVMSLLYGRIKYSYHRTVENNEVECFFEWDAVEGHEQDWRSISLDYRKELVSLVIKSIKEKTSYYACFGCFHIRIECLLHELLHDKENKVKCIDPVYHNTTSYDRYQARVYHTLQRQGAVTEVFLWWRLGIRKSNEERMLLKKCWERFLGTTPSRLQKQTIRLVKARVETLEAEYQRATRIIKTNQYLRDDKYQKEKKAIKKSHFSKEKKEFLLQQVEKKSNVADSRIWNADIIQRRCQTALDFLKGYLDYVSMMSKSV